MIKSKSEKLQAFDERGDSFRQLLCGLDQKNSQRIFKN